MNPDYAEAHFGLGTILVGIPGRLPEAIVHLETAARRNPSLAEAHYNLVFALLKLSGRGRLPEAISHLERAAFDRPAIVGTFPRPFKPGP